MELNHIQFEIKDGEVVSQNLNWIYIWFDGTNENLVIKVGATWLHPAARAEKHLAKLKIDSAIVKAFKIPQELRRLQVKFALIEMLKKQNKLSVHFKTNSVDSGELLPSQVEIDFASDIYRVIYPDT